MTQKILKAVAATFPDFPALVTAHARELAEHDAHMTLVRKSEAAAKEAATIADEEQAVAVASHAEADATKKQELERRRAVLKAKRLKLQEAAESAQRYPGPQAHPLIDSAVKRSPGADGTTIFEPDFEVVEALPVKVGDAAELRTRKDYLLNKISQMENAAIAALLPPGKWRAYAHRMADIEEADMKRRKVLVDAKTPEDNIEKNVIAARSPDDNKFMDEHNARSKVAKAIQRHASDLMSQVEDLTENDLHLWQPAEFPKG
jgi:hypothetical protein